MRMDTPRRHRASDSGDSVDQHDMPATPTYVRIQLTLCLLEQETSIRDEYMSGEGAGTASSAGFVSSPWTRSLLVSTFQRLQLCAELA